MEEQFIFPEKVKQVFEQAALVGKIVKDLWFYGDDPFLNKQAMVTIFNNLAHYGAIRAKKIKKNDIPDDIMITRGRSAFRTKFLLVFSDDSAIKFCLDGRRSSLLYLQPGHFDFPKHRNNIDEHKLFSPVFGRTIKDFQVWERTGNGEPETKIEISFSEGLLLLLSDIGVSVMETHDSPMQVSIGEYRKMVPGYTKLFDKKRVLFRSKLPLIMLEQQSLTMQDQVAYRLEQAFWVRTGDVNSVYKFMSSLKTFDDQMEVLEVAERDGEKASLMELAVTIYHINHRIQQDELIEVSDSSIE